MHKLFALTLLLLSFTTLAETFIKEDSGGVGWQVKKDQLRVSVSLYGQKVHPIDIDQNELLKITLALQSVPFGFRGSLSGVLSKNSVTEQVVRQLIKNKLIELTPIPYDFEILSSEVKLEDIECEKKGLLKRTTLCSAGYRSKMSIQYDR